MKNAFLVCVTGTSRKFYVIEQKKQSGGRFIVRGAWGRIGQAPKNQTKYDGTSEDQARREFAKVLETRLNHGYELVSSS